MSVQKYLLAFVITGAIFATAFYVASRFDSARVADIRATQEAISIDILSTETQFDLLGSLDCSTISESPVLSEELNSLASRLSVAEENLGTNNAEVISIKKQYSLLEIKDYLLMQRLSEKCRNLRPVSVLYFYSNAGDCADCRRMGEVLTYLREEYPGLRVYSFDYHLDLSALHTLIALRKLDQSKGLPALVIQNRAPIYGFKSVDDMLGLAPELKTLATSTATSSTR
jgi:thiol-disulfide isomerase/thioredoxin